MVTTQRISQNWLPAALTFSVIGATILPAAADEVIVIERFTPRRQHYIERSIPYSIPQVRTNAAPYIYGSPIPTPMLVDPNTGMLPRTTTYYSYPRVRQNINDSTLFNPILVNPRIEDSTLINPVIIDKDGRTRVRRSRIYYGW